MLQIIQYQKTGEISVEELPPPTLKSGGVLVKNIYSLISAGTERKSVATAQASMVGKAKSRPDLVKKVLSNIDKEGFIATYKKVLNRLDNYKALGYSSSGIVLESSADEYRPGDRVCCSGTDYASHAEIIFVPKNLTCKLPDNLGFEEGAFGTLGAIAMQGIRQADLRVGETVAVMGLGLLGQITLQICGAMSCNTIGLDISEFPLKTAHELGTEWTFINKKNEVEEKIFYATKGLGVDAVLITADTLSNEPLEIAGEILRDRGRIIIVGAIKTDIPRSPFYEKEIEIRFSRSCGPGRYDVSYEEQGIDYPLGYVRFTEKRNIESFLKLVSDKKVHLKELVTHKIPIKDGLRAYDILMGKLKEPSIGILIECSSQTEIASRSKHVFRNLRYKEKPSRSKIVIGFIGAGNFAQSCLLPHLSNSRLKMICDSNPTNAKSVSQKFKFQAFTTDYDHVLEDEEIDTIFIATRHDSHARFVTAGLNNNKNVFVEKPLALNLEQLNSVREAYAKAIERKANLKLLVGYNRRHSKPFALIKDFFAEVRVPLIVNYRVNAGYLLPEDWQQDISQGYRILSEGCHFIDVMQFLTSSRPARVYAKTIAGDNTRRRNFDNISVLISFENGSIGNLVYLANGSPKVSKEYCEVYGMGKTAVMDGFKSVLLFDSNRVNKKKLSGSKGHPEEVMNWIQNLAADSPPLIDFESLYLTSMTTLKIIESASADKPVDIL
jgi:predicted dehydrogenase/threonine dehydrogenase-like Zn-dependent dehydrogenase